MLNSSCALIDNDFLSHSLDMKKEEDEICDVLSQVFKALDKTPVIHPWIATYEILKNDKMVNKVISESIVYVASWSNVHNGDDNQKIYYQILFKELYKKISGKQLEAVDIFTYCVRGQSLGELHNIATCMFCGCNLILSDDEDTKIFKRIISQTATCNFSVYTRSEVVERIRGIEGTPKRSELRSFAHAK